MTDIKPCYKCFLIGEDSLTLKCGETLINAGHELLGVFTQHPSVVAWAKSNDVPLLSSLNDFERAVTTTAHDLLFSVINRHKLSPACIQAPRLYAINYHDAPLPRYAGVHATAHAILNDEKEHGISWHEMTEKFDAGDTLLQQSFAIAADDTTASLNAKCYEAAITTFPKLLDSLCEYTCIPQPQDEAMRSYYGYNACVPDGGLISWTLPTHEIEKRYRACSFGEAANRFGTLKISLNSDIFVVKKLSIERQERHASPGTLLHRDNQSIRVACLDGIINIEELVSLHGEAVNLQTYIDKHQLSQNKILRSPTNKALLNASNLFVKTLKNELQWVKIYRQASFFDMQNWLAYHADTSTSSERNEAPFFSTLDKTEAIALTCAYFKKLSMNEDECWTIAYSTTNGKIRPLNVNLLTNASLPDLCSQITKTAGIIASLDDPASDIFTRYPCLNSLPRPIKENKFELIFYDASKNKGFCLEAHPHLAIVFINSDDIKIINQGFPLSAKTLDLFARHIEQLSQSLQDNNLPVLQAPYMPSQEERGYMHLINSDAKTSSLPYENVIEAFQESLTQSPNQIAVRDEQESISYQTLDALSTQLAHQLQAKGVAQDDIVALQLKRGITEIVSTLAILKVGASYLPLEYDSPSKRRQMILEDAQARLLIVDSKAHAHQSINTLMITDIKADLADTAAKEIECDITANSCCYIMYSSGTTGKPKGIKVTHQAVLRLVKDTNYVDFYPGINVAHLANPAFDASTFEIWGALLNAGTLYAYPTPEHFNIEDFAQFIKKEPINLVFLTASLFNIMSAHYADCLGKLQQIVIGGERLNPHHIAQLHSMLNATNNNTTKLINGYGPTENTTFSVCHQISRTQSEQCEVPIGKPINRTQAYVVNSHNELLPPYFPGELLLSGQGLAAGYLNNPTLNDEKFISFKAPSGNTVRAYKTGDLSYYDADGYITYIGRLDKQIKKNGFRIELNEIEQVMMQLPTIKQCVVHVDGSSGEKDIVAYCTTAEAADNIDDKTIKKMLENQLPWYMIPNKLIQINTIPLTGNGKVDTAKLTQLASSSLQDAGYCANKPLYHIAQKLMRISCIKPSDDFFELGGDSITAMQLAAEARKNDIPLRISDIFKYPRFRDLEQHLNTQALASNKSTGPETPVNEAPFLLAPTQQWFFNLPLSKPTHFSQSCTLNISKSITKGKLVAALLNLIQRHDSLRLRFAKSHPIKQHYASSDGAKLEDFCIFQETSNFAGFYPDAIQNQFNLESGPLMGVVLLKDAASEANHLLIVIHHLLVDIVSWHVLLNDLSDLLNEKSIVPQGYVTPYRTWVEQQLLLPYKKPFSACTEELTKSASPFHASFKLDEEKTKQLLSEVKTFCNVPIHIIVLAIVAYAFNACTKKSTFALNLETHGRETHGATLDVSGTVGWLTHILPVNISWQSSEILKIIREIDACIAVAKDSPRQANKLQEAELSINYWGNLDNLLKENELLKCADLSFINSRENPMLALGDINAWVKNKQFELTINCAPSLASSLNIGQFLEFCYDGVLSLLVLSRTSSEITQTEPMLDIQRGILHHSLYENSDIYNVQCIISHDTPLDFEKRKHAWQELSNLHEILRAGIGLAKAPTPRFFVEKSCSAPVYIKDFNGYSEQKKLVLFDKFLGEDKSILFDFEQAPLFRVNIVKFDEDHYKEVISFSHTILDGWSLFNILQQLQHIYEYGSVATSDCKPPRFFDYVTWLRSSQKPADVVFWRNRLKGLNLNPFPGTRNNAGQQDKTHAKRIIQTLPENLHCAVHDFCKENRVTLSSFFQAIWATFLSQHTKQKSCSYGLTFSGRSENYPHSNKIVGMLSNVLPFSIDNVGDNSFLSLVKQIQSEVSNLILQQHNSLHFIKQSLGLKINEALFDTVFAFENYPIDEGFSQKTDIRDATHYPLTFSVYPESSLKYILGFNANIFNVETISLLSKNIISLIESAVTQNKNVLSLELKHENNAETSTQYQQAQAEANLTSMVQNEKLLDIWQHILQQLDINYNDNFFDLGGSSFSSLRLMGNINDEFSLQLPLKFVFDHPTLGMQAKKIEALLTEKSQKVITKKQDALSTSLICLKESGSKPPLFLIHPVGGTVFWFMNLAEHFDDDRPLYAIQDPGLQAPHDIHFKTIEAMADAYVKLIKTVAPTGPYYLGGASAGATTSIAMAHQLMSHGEQVDFIGLFDGWVPFPQKLKDRECFERNMHRQFEYMKQDFAKQGISEADELLQLQWIRSRMNAAYKVPYINNKITLFKAMETVEVYEPMEAAYNHWETRSPHPIERYMIPGDHESIFQKPNVTILAKCLKYALNPAETQSAKKLLGKRELQT